MTQQTLRLLIDGFKRGKHQQSYGISIKVGLWAWRRLFYLVEPILQGIEHGRAINCQVHLVSLSIHIGGIFVGSPWFTLILTFPASKTVCSDAIGPTQE